MKKLFLLFFVSLFFLGCKSDYEESKWIIVNNFDKDIILKTAESAKSLILKLEEFKSVIKLSAQNRTVYTICRYVQELAAEFHSFYNSNRVICDDKELMKSRLALMVAIKTTLKNALDILAVSAPEKM